MDNKYTIIPVHVPDSLLVWLAVAVTVTVRGRSAGLHACATCAHAREQAEAARQAGRERGRRTYDC